MNMKRSNKKVWIVMGLILALSLASCESFTDNGKATTDTETERVTETEVATETETEAETEAGTVTETEIETETEVETTNYDLYEKNEGYAFLYDTSAAVSTDDVTKRYAAHFEVAENTFLSGLTVSCSKTDTAPASMEFSIWAWKGDYNSTVAAEPAYTCTLRNDYDFANDELHKKVWATAQFPAHTIGGGEWLYQISDGTDNVVIHTVATARGGLGGNEIVAVKSAFLNGRSTSSTRLAEAYVTYETYDMTKEIEAPSADGYTKLAGNKAHVIILSGQSNASGQAWNSLLQDKVSAEAWERYNNGYDNVLIYHQVDWANASSGFVPVKLGQGSDVERFGPEVGLADNLSRTYPGETFYIIKSSYSGSGLQLQWQPEAGQYRQFVTDVQAALNKLRVQGLDPEIFAMCWMQGETDAMTLAHAQIYETAFAELVDRINEKFGNYMAEGGMAILDATINEQSNWQYGAIVNAAKRNFSASRQNHYVLDTNALDIDTRDEPSKTGFDNDPMHYDSDDSIELGELFGRGIEQVLTNAGYPVEAD